MRSVGAGTTVGAETLDTKAKLRYAAAECQSNDGLFAW
jgi:hypothetical protein